MAVGEEVALGEVTGAQQMAGLIERRAELPQPQATSQEGPREQQVDQVQE